MSDADPLPRITRVAAYGLVLDDELILLCRIAPHVREIAGRWTLPGGGLEFGEAPADALVREVHEETGLSVACGPLAGIDSYHATYPDRDFHAIRVYYHTHIRGGTLRDEEDGTTDRCAWWPLAEARQLPLVKLVRTGLDLLAAST